MALTEYRERRPGTGPEDFVPGNTPLPLGALAAGTSAGATSFTLDRASAILFPGDFVAVDPGTTNCEIRGVTTVSGATVTLSKTLKIAHNAGAVVAVAPAFVPLSWYGAQWAPPGTSPDAEPGLQAAFDDWPYHQQILEGGQQIYYIALPLVQSGEMRLRNTWIYAKSNYGPLDNNGAMLQMADVDAASYLTATATAADDTFATTTVHRLTVGASLMFKGAVPGGVTAGRRYYAKTVPTATTFTIATTKTGATVDVTSDGSCRLYRNLQALLRWFWDNVLVEGNNIAPVGIRCKTSQPGESKKVRIHGCTYKGAVIGGQDGLWQNLMIFDCPTCLVISDAEESEEGVAGTSAYQRFYQLNVEGDFDTGIRAYGHNSVVHDLHMEGGNNGCVGVVNYAETTQFKGDTYMNMGGSVPHTKFRLMAGDIIAENINAVSASGSIADVLLDDQVNGQTILLSDLTGTDHTAAIRLLDTTFKPSVGSGENYQYLIRGGSGRYLRFGARNDPSHTLTLAPATTQTGRQLRILDTSGNEAFAVTVAGHPLTAKNVAPASGDLANGEAAFWWDSTTGNPVLKVTGKDAAGTVFTLTIGSPVLKSLIDAKGDLIVGTADDTAARLAIGTNGYILVADSTQSAGMKWAAPQAVAVATPAEVIFFAGGSASANTAIPAAITAYPNSNSGRRAFTQADLSNMADCRLVYTSESAGTTYTKTISAVDTAADTLTVTAHGVSENQPVGVGGTTVPGGTTANTTYFAHVVDANTLQLMTMPSAGAYVDLTSAGSSPTLIPTSLAAQYSTDKGTTWFWLDGASGASGLPACACTVITSPNKLGVSAGPWIAAASAAKADQWLRLVTVGGDGTTTPQINGVRLQVR